MVACRCRPPVAIVARWRPPTSKTDRRGRAHSNRTKPLHNAATATINWRPVLAPVKGNDAAGVLVVVTPSTAGATIENDHVVVTALVAPTNTTECAPAGRPVGTVNA
jgi:hypothetical protein